MFHAKKFQRPPAMNAPGYFWFLNAPMSEAEVRAQIRDMAKIGARTVCPHPFPKAFRAWAQADMQPDYLTEEYFKMYRVMADECKREHLSCYLYDEGGWPSGGACGQVYAIDPERYARKFLVPDGKNGFKVEREPENSNPQQAPGGQTDGDPEETRSDNWSSQVPNLLMPEVTQHFIRLTHEGYKRHIKEFFGNPFYFVFTDEPAIPPAGPGRLPWTDDLFTEFQKRKGYDAAPWIPEILAESARPEVLQVQRDYTDVVSQLFVERYLRPVRAWCRKHGLLFGGHFSVEDNQANCHWHDHGGQTLRVLRELDFPGVDVIWRQLWPGQRLHPFPKFASSAANQNGSKFVSGEIFGVYGSGLTPAQMKFLIDYMCVCGVNTFIACSRPYSTKGGLIGGERPHGGPVSPLWRHLKPYHDYTARMSYLATLGKPAAETALFFDTLTLWGGERAAQHFDEEEDKIAYRLLEQQSDFDYVDDDVLATALFRKGKLVIGKAAYDRLVLPVGCKMTEAASARVEKLKKQGLAVVSSDETASIPPTLQITPADWRFRVRKHRFPNGSALYIVLNISSCAITREFTLQENGPVALCHAAEGKLYRVAETGKWSWSFAPYASAVFLTGPDAAGAETPPELPGEVLSELNGKWTLRAVRQTVVGEDDYVTHVLRGKARKVRLGDWRKVLGEGFSGEAVYTTEFAGAAAAGAKFLDLGKVCYLAEVRLNGEPLPAVWFDPFAVAISGKVKPGKNVLEITVVNTLANAIAAPGVYEKWKTGLPFMWPYEERQRLYEEESLPSGLFGPVRFRKS